MDTRKSNQKHKQMSITNQYIKSIILLNMKIKERETKKKSNWRDFIFQGDPKGQKEESYVSNLLSKFQSDLKVNEAGFLVLLRWLNEYVNKFSLSFLPFKGCESNPTWFVVCWSLVLCILKILFEFTLSLWMFPFLCLQVQVSHIWPNAILAVMH